jgi:hypothetical protein
MSIKVSHRASLVLVITICIPCDSNHSYLPPCIPCPALGVSKPQQRLTSLNLAHSACVRCPEFHSSAPYLDHLPTLLKCLIPTRGLTTSGVRFSTKV